LSIFPAARLPKYVPGELSAEDIVSEERVVQGSDSPVNSRSNRRSHGDGD